MFLQKPLIFSTQLKFFSDTNPKNPNCLKTAKKKNSDNAESTKWKKGYNNNTAASTKWNTCRSKKGRISKNNNNVK